MENQDLERDVFVLEWTFEPADFFEYDLSYRELDHSLTFTPGRVEMRLAAADFEDGQETRKRLHDELNQRFRIVQVLTHRPYTLNGYQLHWILADGTRKNVPQVYEASGSGVIESVVMLRGAGSGHDPRPQRWREQVERAAKGSKRDPLLAKLIESYGRAVNNPDHEFYHLYEVREALVKEFETGAKARETLGISKDGWSRFGKLMNDPDIKQGRHLGKNTGNVRPATASEVKECRELARMMIFAYLEYVESQS